MIQDPLALTAVIVGITALAFWLARSFDWAGRVGATLLVIAFGAVLSNLDLVAARSVVYGMISGPITSLAIVWLLFAVDLRSLRAAGARMLGAFGLALGATVAGGLVAFALVGSAFRGLEAGRGDGRHLLRWRPELRVGRQGAGDAGSMLQNTWPSPTAGLPQVAGHEDPLVGEHQPSSRSFWGWTSHRTAAERLLDGYDGKATP